MLLILKFFTTTWAQKGILFFILPVNVLLFIFLLNFNNDVKVAWKLNHFDVVKFNSIRFECINMRKGADKIKFVSDKGETFIGYGDYNCSEVDRLHKRNLVEIKKISNSSKYVMTKIGSEVVHSLNYSEYLKGRHNFATIITIAFLYLNLVVLFVLSRSREIKNKTKLGMEFLRVIDQKKLK